MKVTTHIAPQSFNTYKRRHFPISMEEDMNIRQRKEKVLDWALSGIIPYMFTSSRRRTGEVSKSYVIWADVKPAARALIKIEVSATPVPLVIDVSLGRSRSAAICIIPTPGTCSMHGVVNHVCLLYTASDDRDVLIWDTVSRKRLGRIQPPNKTCGTMRKMAISDRHLFVGSSNGIIYIYPFEKTCERPDRHECSLAAGPVRFCLQVRVWVVVRSEDEERRSPLENDDLTPL